MNGRTVVSVGSGWAARNAWLPAPTDRAQSQAVHPTRTRPVSAQLLQDDAAACAPARR